MFNTISMLYKFRFKLAYSFLIVLFVSATTAGQTLLLNENFNYALSDNTLLTNSASPGDPTTGWYFVGTNSATTLNFKTAGLSFSGYSSSGIGGHAIIGNTGQDISKDFTSVQTNGSTVYAAFLANVTTVGTSTTTGDYFFSFNNSTNFGGRLFVKNNGAGGYVLGMQTGLTGSLVYSTSSYSLNTTYLIVVKYQLITGATNDLATVYVYPTGSIPSIESSIPAISAVTSGTEAFSSGIKGVLLRQGGGTTTSPIVNLDGIRVSTDWATAVNSNVNTAPSLSNPVASSIASTSATLGASLTSFGWNSSTGNDATVTERGIVWSTLPSPTTADNKVSGGSGINFTVSATGLPAGTKIYYRGYAINPTGTSYSSDGFIYTEPAGHVTNFSGSVTNSSTVDLTWTPVADAAGYLIISKIGSVPTGLPTDATSYSAGNTFGDATVRSVVMGGSSTAVTVSGLSAADYYFQIIPFGYDGTNTSTFNYKTDGTIPAKFLSTVLGSSDLIATSGFVYPSNINYESFQSSDVTSANSVAVMGLTIRDGGSGLNDADATPTVLSGLTITVTNPSILRKAAIYDGNTELEEVSVAGSPIIFSNITATATDGSTKDLTLRVTYQSSVTDNTQNQFTVSNVNSQAGNSGFAVADGGGATSSVLSDNNRIEVIASQLAYFSQPVNNSSFYSGSVWGTPIVVYAYDSNSNLDLDYSGFVSLTPDGSGTLSGNLVTASAGVATFNNLNHNTTETIQLTASSGGLATALSNTFIVFAPLQTIGVQETFVNAPTFDNSSWTFAFSTATGSTYVPASASTVPLSSGYSGASGGKYMNFPFNSGKNGTMTISGINTTNLTNLNVSFGYYQASTLASAGVTTLEWSTDGVTYNPISLSGVLPSSIGWALISNVALPSGAITANLRLRFKVDYSITTGAIRIDDIKLQASSSFANEPTIVSSGLNSSNIGNISFDANWTNGNGQKRLVLAKSGAPVDANPIDGTNYTANSVFGNGSQLGTGNFVVYIGTGTTVPLTGLTQGQNYQFAVYDFNGSGSTANYLTTGVPTASQTTINAAYASLSTINIVNGSESDSISSVVNHASPLSSTDGSKVFDLFIQDGNGINDFDVLATVVDSLRFTAGASNEVSDWTSVIKSAALFDGTTLVAEAIVGQNSLTFKPSSPISVSDNGSKTVSVRLSLKNTGITDNEKLQFNLASSGVFAGTSGSQFGSITTTETNGNKNKIYVQATQIRFTVQPTLTKVGNSITPALTVEATDANLNRDLTYNSNTTLTSNTAFDGSSVNSGVFTSGIASFNSVKPGAANNQSVLYANSGSLSQAVSDTFTVYALAVEPTVAASNLQFTSVGNTSMDLGWTNGNGAKRIVVAKAGSAVNANILDEVTYTADSSFGIGSQIDTGNYVIYSGTGNRVSVTGLSQNQTYHFAVYEVSGSGISTNYLTSSVLTGSQATLNVAYASLSTINIVNGSESDSISSVVNHSSPLSSTDGSKVFDLFIQDGNGINDFDVLATVVDSLKFTAGASNEVSDWTSVIKSAALFDGTTLVAEAIVDQNSLTFKPSSPISVSDNGSKTVSVRLSLKNTGITDNEKLQFNLASSGVFAGTSGSQFGSITTTETNGNKNKIYVQATQIRFTVQPTLTKVGNSITPALTVEATDANLNRDLTYNSNTTLTSNTAFDGSSVNSGVFTSGVVSFNSVKPGAANNQSVLYANSGSLTQAVSDTFTVYALAVEPTVASSNLQFTSVGNTSMKLTWNKGNGSNRIVIAKAGSAVSVTPFDENSYSADSQFGSGSDLGTGNFAIYNGTDSSVILTGLSANTEYYFSIYEFTGSGISLNYASTSFNGSKTTLSVDYASESSAQLVDGSESLEISSIVNNSSPLAATEGTRVFSIQIKDGSSFNDFDSKPTKVNALLVNQSGSNQVSDWTSAIKAAGLFYNSELICDGSVNSNSIVFSFPAGFSVPDDSSRILSVRISLKENGLVDGQTFGFAIDASSFGAESSGSQFSSFASFETSAGSNKIQVIASKLNLDFVSRPTSVSVAVLPSPTLTATDSNGNIDSDFNGLIDVTSNNSFDGSSEISKSANSGTVTFDNLIFSSVNFKTALTFSHSGMTDVKSDSFMVFVKSIPVAGDIAINQLSSNFRNDNVQLIELVNKTDKYFDLSDLKLRVLSSNGFALDFNGNLSGILFPNRFWLMATKSSVKISESDSILADAVFASVLSSNQQVGLVKNDNSVIDGISFGTISNDVYTEGNPAIQNGAGTSLKRKINAFDTNTNSTDYISVSDNEISIRNHNSYFFGSGSTVVTESFNDIWLSGNVSAPNGLSVTTRFGIENGKLDVSGNSLNLGSSVTVIDTNSWVVNKISTNLSGIGAYNFEVGSSTAAYNIQVNLKTIPTNATNLQASFTDTDPGNDAPMPSGILSYWTGGYWSIESNGNNSTGEFDLSIETDSIKGFILENQLGNYVILQRVNSESEWTVSGLSVSNSGSILTATGITGFGEFTLGEIDPETVPVEVTGFSVYQENSSARLVWTTQTETNNNGFSIDKKIKGNNKSDWEFVGFVNGKGTTTQKQNYQFSDINADQACEYRLSQTDLSGKVNVLGTVIFDGIIRKFELVGNYPNPFNPETTVLFRLPVESNVRISIYNNLGQVIRVVKNENMKAGNHEIKIIATDLSSGIYFYEVLTGDNNRAIKKMVLVK